MTAPEDTFDCPQCTSERAEARRRTACAQRTEQQIRAIVRDENRLFVTGDES